MSLVRTATSSLPAGRFILAVDRQRKAGFEDQDAALQAGIRIKSRFPRLDVQIFDRQGEIYLPIEASAIPEDAGSQLSPPPLAMDAPDAAKRIKLPPRRIEAV